MTQRHESYNLPALSSLCLSEKNSWDSPCARDVCVCVVRSTLGDRTKTGASGSGGGGRYCRYISVTYVYIYVCYIYGILYAAARAMGETLTDWAAAAASTTTGSAPGRRRRAGSPSPSLSLSLSPLWSRPFLAARATITRSVSLALRGLLYVLLALSLFPIIYRYIHVYLSPRCFLSLLSLFPHYRICANLPKSVTKPQMCFWKFVFEHTFGARFFSLFVVYIREIHGCTASIEWYTFSRTTSYFLRKCQKKLFSSNLSHVAQKRSTQSFKKEIKTRKKEL